MPSFVLGLGTQPTVNTTEAALFPVPVFGTATFRGPVGFLHRREPHCDR